MELHRLFEIPQNSTGHVADEEEEERIALKYTFNTTYYNLSFIMHYELYTECTSRNRYLLVRQLFVILFGTVRLQTSGCWYFQTVGVYLMSD